MMKDLEICNSATPLEVKHEWSNLTRSHSTNVHKATIVKTFFEWITHNISYDLELFNSNPESTYITSPCQQNECLALDAIRTRKAVCTGYADLFYHFCSLSHIRCVRIPGHVKGVDHIPGDLLNPDIPNHMWNAVFINHSWHLVDVTWGTGYVDKSTETYHKTYTPHYLFTSPEDFILDHRPLDAQWQLLKDIISLESFLMQPSFGLTYIANRFKLKECLRGDHVLHLGESLDVCLQSTNQRSVDVLSTAVCDIRHLESGIILPGSRVKLAPSNSSEANVSIKPPFPGSFLSYINVENNQKSLVTFRIDVQMNPTQHIQSHFMIHQDIASSDVKDLQLISDANSESKAHNLHISTCHSYIGKIVKCQVFQIKELNQTKIDGLDSVACDNRLIKLRLRNQLSGVYKIILYEKCKEDQVYERMLSSIMYLH